MRNRMDLGVLVLGEIRNKEIEKRIKISL